MVSAQGAEAADRVKEVQAVIRELADDWDMDKEWADHLCSSLGVWQDIKNSRHQKQGKRAAFLKTFQPWLRKWDLR